MMSVPDTIGPDTIGPDTIDDSAGHDIGDSASHSAGDNVQAPAIRFKGFNAPWEEKMLGDFGSVAMNKRIFRNQTSEKGDVPFFKIGTFGDIPDAFISRELFENYRLKYPFPERGDLLISASGSIGRIVEFEGGEQYFQDSNIVWLNHGGDIENSFLRVFYSIVKWSGLEGSTIKRLYNKNILETAISIPIRQEQKKIGQYFQQLDRLIALHQQKHDKLCHVKKALLEKMFPKQGRDTPAIRFKGFSAPWEEKRLGDVVMFNPKSELPATFKYVDLESVVGTKIISYRTEHIDTAPSRAQRLANKGDVFYQTVRPYQKNNYLFDKEVGDFVFSTGYAQMRPLGDSYFLLSAVQNLEFVKIVLDNCTGTSYPAISSNDLGKITRFFPNIKEQTKIGNLFQRLDTLINQHQRQIKKLGHIKQACLAKMFV